MPDDIEGLFATQNNSERFKAFNSLTDSVNINFGMFQLLIDVHSDRYGLKSYLNSATLFL
ncbi:MAG: hypothetical protein O4804_17945 [Trichodesmium sp. St11_bin5]|nr:hypothetical protein [Trichodesmium sp. St11_bin5]